MTDLKPVWVLGVGICATNIESTLESIDEWATNREQVYISTCTVHLVMECQDSPEVLQAVNSSTLALPDGMPMVWLARRAGHRQAKRVCGPDLLVECMRRQQTARHRHFLYGGEPGVPERLANRLSSAHPAVRIVGTYSPPFGDLDSLCSDEAAHRINSTHADIVWVGLGAPKQDLWMHRMRSKLEAPVLIGVGAAFNFSSGRVARAPAWIQTTGLEWLFRFAQEPRRLWKRYFIVNTRFVVALGRERLHLDQVRSN
jgi:N-acetylglucosaminyldiphosphoundecaprenol N-acetyl-beta-D-mannosaminyltransferase